MTVVVRTDAHPRRDDGLPLAAVILWAIGALCSVLAGYVALSASPHSVLPSAFPIWGALLHLLASVLAFVGTRTAKGNHPSGSGWAWLVTFFTFFGGPLGFLAGVACYLFGVGQPTEMPLVDVVKAEMFVKSAPAHHPSGDTKAFDVELREELQTQPIIDLLPYADISTAIAIINKLASQRKPADILLLRRVAQDPRPEVYQFALSKLDEFEREFATRIFQMQEQVSLHPREASMRVELAKVHYGYVTSGLLDDSLEDYYWEMTLAQLFEAMRLEANRVDVVVDMARMFLLRGMFLEAEKAVEDVLRKEPGNLDAQLVLMESLVERAQVESNPLLMQQARLRALETAWAVKVPRTREQHPLFEAAQFWFGRNRSSLAGGDEAKSRA